MSMESILLVALLIATDRIDPADPDTVTPA
jgi:hypothetical protein